MTRAQEAAIARVCAHECLMGELVKALWPFVINNSSEEFITIRVRTEDVTRARAVLARAKEQST